MLTLLISFFVLLFIRVPVAIGLALSTIFVLLMSDFNMNMMPQRMFTALDSFPMMAIPGFVLAGVIMARGGISKYLIEALRSWVGHLTRWSSSCYNFSLCYFCSNFRFISCNCSCNRFYHDSCINCWWLQ